ncbi:MAG: hypothetical protein CM15mP102_03110 [Flavobacteriales bacterium]|nr:MAG: hypothetical protein CM15mP102_03110 [Flavobacteriales bacterium]
MGWEGEFSAVSTLDKPKNRHLINGNDGGVKIT